MEQRKSASQGILNSVFRGFAYSCGEKYKFTFSEMVDFLQSEKMQSDFPGVLSSSLQATALEHLPKSSHAIVTASTFLVFQDDTFFLTASRNILNLESAIKFGWSLTKSDYQKLYENIEKHYLAVTQKVNAANNKTSQVISASATLAAKSMPYLVAVNADLSLIQERLQGLLQIVKAKM
jgi:hypothetical protein